jgi:Rrf2 family transcriptional regulator, cysteine metabolism repressor
MRVTAKGEYASQAVLHLALQWPEVVTIQEIASRHHIPLKYLEQILLELKRGGVLESRRGVKGGYTLARTPSKISMGEEGESCGLKAMWGDVQLAVEKILFATSLEDVRRRTLSGRGKNAEFARFGAIKSEVMK